MTLAEWTMGGTAPPNYSYKAADVSFANASYFSLVGGTQGIDNTDGNPASPSWYATGWSATTGNSTYNSPSYYQFEVDTSKYGGVTISFMAKLVSTGDWAANNNNHIYIYSQADYNAFSTILSTQVNKGSWYGPFSAKAQTTGNVKTTFRVNADTRSKSTAMFYIDTVTIKGCPRPTALPPNITMSFSPATIATNAQSVLTYTITNPNSASALTGITFENTFPSNMTIASTTTTNTCAGTLTDTGGGSITVGDTGIKLTGGTLAAGAICTITVRVTAATKGLYTNVTGYISATEGGMNSGTSGYAVATLKALDPPSIRKEFAPTTIVKNSKATLIFRITNPNSTDSLTGVAFTDNLPAGIVVATPPNATTSGCGTPTFSPSGGSTVITFSNGTILPTDTCTVTVDVTATISGTLTNTSGPVSHTLNSTTYNGNTATAQLTVRDPIARISLAKSIATSSSGPWRGYVTVQAGSNVWYRFVVENTGDVNLSNVSVSDPQVNTSSCTWSNPLTPGSYEECIVGPIVTVAGSHTNTATAVGYYNSVAYTDQSSATYATGNISLTKTSTETDFKNANDQIHYTFTVTNTGAAILFGPLTVTDNKTTPTCPALTTVGDNDNFFDPGESITCTATYTVTINDVKQKQITNSATATISGFSSTATHTLYLAPADLTAVKTNNVNNQIALGGTFDWTITLANTTTAGSAPFTNGNVLLSDNLPETLTYTLGTVKGSGITGTINCTLNTNDLTCSASGDVVVPSKLSGTVSVTNGSAVVTGTGTSFTTELSVGSVILIAGVPYKVQSIANNTSLTLTENYSGATASGLSIPGSFSITVTAHVPQIASGTITNPRSGGACKADPNNSIAESNEGNNDCANTLTILSPSLTVLKSYQVYSDPVNGTSSPKPIPGSEIIYEINVTNSGNTAADSDSIRVTDQIPTNTSLCVSTSCYNPPIVFICSSSPSCGLTFNLSTDVTYYNASDQVYTPNPDANGYDPLVRKIVLNPKGALSGSTGPPHPNFIFRFKVKIE